MKTLCEELKTDEVELGHLIDACQDKMDKGIKNVGYDDSEGVHGRPTDPPGVKACEIPQICTEGSHHRPLRQTTDPPPASQGGPLSSPRACPQLGEMNKHAKNERVAQAGQHDVRAVQAGCNIQGELLEDQGGVGGRVQPPKGGEQGHATSVAEVARGDRQGKCKTKGKAGSDS